MTYEREGLAGSMADVPDSSDGQSGRSANPDSNVKTKREKAKPDKETAKAKSTDQLAKIAPRPRLPAIILIQPLLVESMPQLPLLAIDILYQAIVQANANLLEIDGYPAKLQKCKVHLCFWFSTFCLCVFTSH